MLIYGLLSRARARYADWRDAALDRKYGIETKDVVTDMEATGVSGEHAPHGNHYEPIQLAVFERIVAALPISPAEFTFVDFGSGKGRALVLAAEHGFRRAIGVEYAVRLHEAAERNVARYRRLGGTGIPIELHCADAAELELPPEESVCFFYNPFDGVVMAKVLANIRASLHAAPRRLFVVYRNPRHPEVMANSGFLRCVGRNSTFEIYAAK
ncbi:MAG: class I SAM-dependent methyltransferase [Betaproteobacteria bacterium]|nr:MAG: class I SAM-dependent methyltransferase [Betaproteobacteria bacterium]